MPDLRVLFATAELTPIVSAGGLGEAASGLTAALRAAEVDVVTALPDYTREPLQNETLIPLDVPDWAAPASARIGDHPDAGRLALIDVPGIERPNPYVDKDGEGWPDNDARFAAFSAALAPLARYLDVSVVHLNDWHTAYAPPFLDAAFPTVLTIHNLGHQGHGSGDWVHQLPVGRDVYQWGDGINLLAGAISSVDRVTTVSPTYAEEVLDELGGMDLHERLAAAPGGVLGIRNGIDIRAWDPATDVHVPNFSDDDMAGKAAARSKLLDHVGWDDGGEPLTVLVTRLVEQKGIDMAFEAARFLEGMNARMIVLGSGDKRLAEWASWLMDKNPERFWFHNGYDAPLSHLLFAGGDLLLMPSRFEPCGLAQMQAMAYGTIPIVTPVGGLLDTVVDADADKQGNGFVATSIDDAGIVDVLHRALRSFRHSRRRTAIQRRGMTTDWSWSTPAQHYLDLYRSLQ